MLFLAETSEHDQIAHGDSVKPPVSPPGFTREHTTESPAKESILCPSKHRFLLFMTFLITAIRQGLYPVPTRACGRLRPEKGAYHPRIGANSGTGYSKDKIPYGSIHQTF